jgi:hypothetical protein
MAQQVTTTGGTFTVPGAYPDEIIQNTPGGLSTTGVIAIIGESDSGPAFSEELPGMLNKNGFGPGKSDAVKAKYGLGNLLDGHRGCANPSNDQQIPGGPFRIIPVKTNVGVKASGTLPMIGGGTYATLRAKLGGKKGNLFNREVTVQTDEVVPTTGSLLFASPQVSTVVAFRVSGAAEVTTTIGVGTLPSAAVTAINGLTGVAATGGANRSLITAVAGNLTMTLDTGFQCHLVIDTAWANNPEVGDIAYLPTGSPFAAANEGTYVVLAATDTRLDLYKLLDAAGTGATRTAPTTETVAVAATTNAQAFSPVVISHEAGAVTPGLGKSLELANSGSNSISHNLFVFDGATVSPPASAYDRVSTSTAPDVLAASAEYQVDLNVARAEDATNVDLGRNLGQVVLTLGYTGTTATAEIADGVLTTAVTGGSGADQEIELADFSTIGDLVAYLNSLTGYTAAAGTAAQSQRLSTDLDEGTYDIGTTHGAPVGRIKADGARFMAAVNASAQVDLVPVGLATKPVGLPDVAALAFLTGGSRGSTSDADILAALDALRKVRCNFVVTLFSQDADDDITAGTTDADSTYTIAAINANLRAHVMAMSTQKKRRHRQGFASFRGTFTDALEQAGNLAQGRVACAFQDAKDTSASGGIVQFNPWMTACKAAGMQAAGFYKPIFNKLINVSGAVQAAADWDDQDDEDQENALLGGLLPLTELETGGFKFVSDQTTYTRDNNFALNSIQAIYVADTIALTTAKRMEAAFVGQSLADVPAPLALTTFEGILDDMRRLKLIAPHAKYPKGYTGQTIEVQGGVMYCNVTISLAGAIYFVPINFLVQPAQQSAG